MVLRKIQKYRIILSCFLLLIFCSYSSFALVPFYEGLPFKIKRTKVSVKLVGGDIVEGYLVDANDTGVRLVSDKKEIAPALLSDCQGCIEIKKYEISEINKQKNKILKLFGLVIAGLLFSTLGSGNSDDGGYFYLKQIGVGFSFFNLFLIVIEIIDEMIDDETYREITLESAKYHMMQEENKSKIKFYNNWENKSYTFYYDNYTQKVYGKAVNVSSKETTVSVISENGLSTVSFPTNRLNYVK